MKTLTIHGVPYNVEDDKVFLYGEEPPLTQIGTYDAAAQTVVLFPDWQSKAAPALAAYRATLKAHAEESMRKARELQGLPA